MPLAASGVRCQITIGAMYFNNLTVSGQMLIAYKSKPPHQIIRSYQLFYCGKVLSLLIPNSGSVQYVMTLPPSVGTECPCCLLLLLSIQVSPYSEDSIGLFLVVVWQTSFSFTCPSPEGPSPLATSDPFLIEKQDDNQYLITADSAPRVLIFVDDHRRSREVNDNHAKS